MRLPLKILLFLLPLIVTPLLFTGSIAYEELRQSTEQNKFDEMRSQVNHVVQEFDNRVATATANIELFANNNILRKYVLNDDEGQRYALLHGPLMRVFQSFQKAYPEYYEIRILMNDGYEDIRRTTSFIPNANVEEGKTRLFTQILDADENETYTTVMRNKDNGEVSLYVSKPLVLSDQLYDPLSSAPVLRGYLVLTIDLGVIETLVESGLIGNNGFLLIADDGGRALFRPESIGEDSGAVVEYVENNSGGGGQGFVAPLSINGNKYFTLAQRPHANFNVMANYPESELLEITHKLAATVWAITVVTIAITTIFVFMLVHYLVIRRIRVLGRLTSEIAHGNMSVSTGMTANDEIGELACSIERMASGLRDSDKQIRYLAYHDSLTGLPNRAMFKEYLDRVIASSRRNGQQFALLFLDIDDFKRINDSLGHQVGDRLLQEISDRLSHSLRNTDYLVVPGQANAEDRVLARLGGDEFTILLPDIRQARVPGSVARRLISALSERLLIENNEFFVSASIGITLFPVDSDNADGLLKTADIAMYHAKEQGKDNYQYYRESMNIAVHERLNMENRLRKALFNGELRLHYQPQVSMQSGCITGVEALARWYDDEAGEISPSVFIPLAEEAGLILNLGSWVLNESCRQLHEWREMGLEHIRLSVNVSNIQFERQNVAELIADALACNFVDAGSFGIEITESTIMSDPDRATEQLEAVRQMGVNIALDDFGTGYSSLGTLHRFPIDTLKIDQSFVNNIDDSDDKIAIVSAIIAMAHILKLEVVAEGVEKQSQLNILERQQCDIIQGYVYGKPATASEITGLLIESASVDSKVG